MNSNDLGLTWPKKKKERNIFMFYVLDLSNCHRDVPR